MAENEDYSSCESLTSVGNAQAMIEDNEQLWNHLQHANLLLEDPTSSETSWTNEKHSLFLNSIEDAFVSSLYQQGYYTYPCKRWQADKGEISSAFNLDLDEEVESGFSDGHLVFGFVESQSESEMPRIHRHAQNHSKRCKLKRMGGNRDIFQEPDRNEKRNKRKLEHEVADSGREITHVFQEVQSRHNDEQASNFYAGQDRFTQNSAVSETSLRTIGNNQDDQVVPSIDEKSAEEDGKPR